MATQYERKLLNDVKALFEENDKLKVKIAKIEAETAAKYLAVIDKLNDTIDALAAKCAALEARAAMLETENERLRRQLNNDSGNSSNPPSSDIKPNAPNTFNGRTKTDKKSGGQQGHKGKYLSKASIKEKIASGQMRRIIINHGQPSGEYVSKYVVDIKLDAVATEHRFYGKTPIPRDFRPDVQYGNDIKSVVATLAGQGLVASNRITEMLKSMSGGAIELSDGAVYDFLTEFDCKAQKTVGKIKTKLLNNAVLHIDETGVRVKARGMFFRNYSDNTRVLYTVNPTKGKKAIEEDGILPQFAGCLVHDHNTVNYNYGTNNAECNVHLIRYLKANFENTRHEWSNDLIAFLLSLKRAKDSAIGYGMSGFEISDVENYRKRFDEIVENGFEALKTHRKGYFQQEEQKLLKRLQKYRENHILFATNFSIPFDNNLSERDLRMLKIKNKVSGCFRSLSGAKIFANLMSVIKTAIKQNLSPYKAIHNVFNQIPCLTCESHERHQNGNQTKSVAVQSYPQCV